MLIENSFVSSQQDSGFTLIELIIFIVVIGVATAGLFAALNSGVVNSVDPMYQVRALELAQAQVDEILGRRYDENSPSGGVPACGSLGGVACTPAGSLGAEAGEGSTNQFDDIDDFDGLSVNAPAPFTGFTIAVVVSYAGTDLTGLPTDESAKLITVTVTPPVGNPVTLSTYRGNF